MKFGTVKPVTSLSLKNDFVSHDYQRELRTPIIKDCIDNMRREGFWKSHPIVYIKRDGKNMVVWGHHRREAAMKLGITAYVSEMSDATYEQTVQLITDENWNTWKVKETIFREIQAGNPHYIRLYGFVKRGLTITCAADLLSGGSGNGCNNSVQLKKGGFRVTTTKRAELIVSLIERCQNENPIIRNTNFVKALSRCMNVEVFSLPTFEKKLVSSPITIGRKSNIEDFSKAIEAVYNFQSRNPIPLAFMADQEARRRAAAVQKERSAA